MLKSIIKKNNEKNLKEKKIKNYPKIILTVVFLLIISIEVSYYFYNFYNIHIEKTTLDEEISLHKEGIKSLASMSQETEKANSTEEKEIKDRHEKKEYLTGIKIDKVEILEKITKKGYKEKYFKTKMYYNVNNKDDLKDLVVIKFLDPKVFKITNVTDKYIEIILKEE
jgi:hypothetical protein